MRRLKAVLVAVVMCSAVQSAQEPSGPATPKLREAVVASGGEPATPKLAGSVPASEGGPVPPKLGGAVAPSEGGRTTWTDFGGGPDNARYLTLDKINKSNLQQLAVAWTYPTRDNISYVFNPVVVDNVMYVLARNNSLVALDASTGNRAIAMDVGDLDGLRTDAAKLHDIFDNYGLANTFEIYSGTHTSKLADRFQNHVLPFLPATCAQTAPVNSCR